MNLAKKNWPYSMYNCALVVIFLLSSLEKTNAWGEFFSKGVKLPTIQPPAIPKDENVQSIASFAKPEVPQPSPQLPSLLASNPLNGENPIDPIKLSTESNEELPAKLVRSTILKSPSSRRQPWQNPRTMYDAATPKLLKDKSIENNVAEPHEILKTEYEKLLEKLNQLRESMTRETQNSKDNDPAKTNNFDASPKKILEKNNDETERLFDESTKKSRRLPSFNETLSRRRQRARNFLGPYSRYLDENTRRRVNMKEDDKDDDEKYDDREEEIKKTTLSRTTTTTTEKPTTTTTNAPTTKATTARPSSPRTKKDDRMYFPEESENGGNYINKHYLEQHRDELDKELDETLNRLREKIRKAMKGEEIDEDESMTGNNNDNDDDENDDLFYPEGADTSCPKNEVYTECGSICEPSCDEPNPDICAKVCSYCLYY